MGVCRGKISEGVDFADARGRVVIITGIPYAPAMDPKVKMKREYIDIAFREKRSVISGNEWYQIQVKAKNFLGYNDYN
jgi:regulator of telomere elongation helicase 1